MMRARPPTLVLLLSLVLVAPSPSAWAGPTDEGVMRASGVTVASDGRVTIGERSFGPLALPAPPRTLQVTRPTVAGRRLVHVVVAGRAGRRAELLITAPPEATEVFAGSTGPQGVDGEWSRHLRVDDTGLLLFERRDGVVRCDGAAVHLFARLYDFDARRFRSARARPAAPRAPALIARREPQATGMPMGAFRLVAASTQRGDGQLASNLVPPLEAEDGKLDTSWSESLGGTGRGEFLTARAASPIYRLRAVRIVPGDARDRRAFADANRLKSALLLLSSGRRYRIRFERDPLREAGAIADFYWARLPEPVSTRCATLLIEDVYPGHSARGGSGGRTAIAELAFLTEVELDARGIDRLVQELGSDDATRFQAAIGVLGGLGTRAQQPLLRALSGATPPLLGRIVRVLSKHPTGAVAEPLTKALPRMRAGTRDSAVETLRAIGPAAIPALLTQLRSGPPAVAATVAPILGAIGGPEAQQALLAAAGGGPPAVRAGVVAGLSAPGVTVSVGALLDTARAASLPARRGDLVLAAARLAARGDARDETATTLAQMLATEKAFEVRYRLLRAIGRLDPNGQLAALATARRAADPVLRWQAVVQIGRASAPRATQLLLATLDDPDPRARAAAARALAPRRAPGIGAALARRFQRERWADAGRALAEALGAHCQAPAIAALQLAVRQQRFSVDDQALLSLIHCRPAGLGGQLIELARAPRSRTAIRKRALSSFPTELARAQLPRVISLYHELRRRALRSSADETVAAAGAGLLARLGGDRAERALTDTIATDASGIVRAAAANAIALHCPTRARPVLRRAVADRTPLVRRAAKLALAKCRW